MVFCTLFDSNYLDKGIALYRSLERCMDDFKLYLLPFDDKCERILKEMNLKSAVVMSLADFETPKLLEIKKKRSRAEYCWTCGCLSIAYVLDTYGEEYVTYLDADLYFYNSPKKYIDEFLASDMSVGITPHRFPDTKDGRLQAKRAGKYCVEFNTFKNNEAGRIVLADWCEACINECTADQDTGQFGDQKYLDEWEANYDCIYVYNSPDLGLAPWNIAQYRTAKDADYLRYLPGHKDIKPVFFHFHQIAFVADDVVRINMLYRDELINPKYINDIYTEYLREIKDIRQEITTHFGGDFSYTIRDEKILKSRWVISGILKEKPFRFRNLLKCIKVLLYWKYEYVKL